MANLAILTLKIVSRQAVTAAKRTEDALSRMNKTAFNADFALAAAGAALTVLAKKGIDAAVAAEETRNKFGVVFRDIPNLADRASRQIADSFDLAESTVQGVVSSTGDLLTGFGFSQKAALDLATQVAILGGDLASFQNVQGGVEEASARLTKGILGETENLKMLGIVVRQDTKAFQDRVQVLSQTQGLTLQQAKAQVILEESIRQSKNAIGDYARTQNSLANRQRRFNEQWKQLKENIGRVVIELLNLPDVMKSINDWMQKLNTSELAITFQIMAVEIRTAMSNSAVAVKWFFDVVSGLFKGFTDNMVTLFNWISDNWDKLWENRGKVVSRTLDTVLENQKSAWSNFFKFLKNPTLANFDRFVLENRGLGEKVIKAAAGAANIKAPEFKTTEIPGFDALLDQLDKNAASREKNISNILKKAAENTTKATEDLKKGVGKQDGQGDFGMMPMSFTARIAEVARAGTAEAFRLMTSRQNTQDQRRDKRAEQNKKANEQVAINTSLMLRSGVPIRGTRTVNSLLGTA